MEKTIWSLSELESEAARFVASLTPSTQGATLVTLSGELGAGKTAFTKAIAKALGIEEIVNSPTFVLEKIYQLGHPMSKFERLIHIDAYRLEKGADLSPLGFDEVMQDTRNLVVLEWPEKVAEALSEPAVKIAITVDANDARTISYD